MHIVEESQVSEVNLESSAEEESSRAWRIGGVAEAAAAAAVAIGALPSTPGAQALNDDSQDEALIF